MMHRCGPALERCIYSNGGGLLEDAARISIPNCMLAFYQPTNDISFRGFRTLLKSVLGRWEIEKPFGVAAMPGMIGSAFWILPNRLRRSQRMRHLRLYMVQCPRQFETDAVALEYVAQEQSETPAQPEEDKQTWWLQHLNHPEDSSESSGEDNTL